MIDSFSVESRNNIRLHNMLSQSEKQAVYRFLTVLILEFEENAERYRNYSGEDSPAFVKGQILYWERAISALKLARFRCGHKESEGTNG